MLGVPLAFFSIFRHHFFLEFSRYCDRYSSRNTKKKLKTLSAPLYYTGIPPKSKYSSQKMALFQHESLLSSFGENRILHAFSRRSLKLWSNRQRFYSFLVSLDDFQSK